MGWEMKIYIGIENEDIPIDCPVCDFWFELDCDDLRDNDGLIINLKAIFAYSFIRVSDFAKN